MSKKILLTKYYYVISYIVSKTIFNKCNMKYEVFISCDQPISKKNLKIIEDNISEMFDYPSKVLLTPDLSKPEVTHLNDATDFMSDFVEVRISISKSSSEVPADYFNHAVVIEDKNYFVLCPEAFQDED